MTGVPIFFEFENEQSAALARETLEELGYRTGWHNEMQHPTLHIHVERNDLTSALEIAQAHGGLLKDTYGALAESDAYAAAYNETDYIPIPAHLVNEDLDAKDEIGMSQSLGAGESDSGNGAEVFDPSDDDYNYFDAGVRL
ncbi:hypothetical protein N0M98_02635 [Paenibacillus doosanensis]|uniref:Uncharacterized protein n=1 Tax=Paenibacillus konkukensis TaxID=2020716 RepID=A0ABY4RRS4_9BACL|nr:MULTISPECIES: hypothetical protein [Paenibacillus]MCS7459028.1 hypothetical protein [Paenibacillus doosanensis]UQZ84082.1 hypothetical protein SK3146_03314 [Paenibacillus konkukensis]